MDNTLLLGRDVKIISNDFINENVKARITYIYEHDRKLVLKLDEVVSVSGVKYDHAIASPRLAKDELKALINSGVIGCTVVWVPKNRFDHSKPLDLTWWRGGGAVITDIVLDEYFIN